MQNEEDSRVTSVVHTRIRYDHAQSVITGEGGLLKCLHADAFANM